MCVYACDDAAYVDIEVQRRDTSGASRSRIPPRADLDRVHIQTGIHVTCGYILIDARACIRLPKLVLLCFHLQTAVFSEPINLRPVFDLRKWTRTALRRTNFREAGLPEMKV